VVGHLRLTTVARGQISAEDAAALDARCRELGVRAGALYSFRSRCWTVGVRDRTRAVELRATGDLAAILAGALDDWEALPAVAA
jgi:hypothetical protein